MKLEQQSQVFFLRNFKPNRLVMLAFYETQGLNSKENGALDVGFVNALLALPVTQLSRFDDAVWDYNDDVINPAKNVQGAKLRINFSKYSFIPAFVLAEIKCLFHYLNLAPMAFAKEGMKRKGKGASKPALKSNTFISQFEAGLRYLNHLFSKLKLDGAEFVEHKYAKVADILEVDFQDAAKDFPFVSDRTLHKFFQYLKHPTAKEILGTEIQVDFETFSWPERETKKRQESLIFSNDDFEKLVVHSSYKVVQFLTMMREEVEDGLSLQHYSVNDQRESLNLSPEFINDYCILRLKCKGYSDKYIFEQCTVDVDLINSRFSDRIGRIVHDRTIRKVIKDKYYISNIDDVRLALNEVYYASAFLVGIYTGMRPSELSEIRLGEGCILSENGIDLLCSEEKKGKQDSLNLFDDKWVAIPIVKDAIKCATILSKLKGNSYLFSNMDTVEAGNPMTNMTSSGIRHFFDNYFSSVFSEKRIKEIKFTSYMLRHTLAYQLFRAELGLPFISFQLKHLVNQVESYTSTGASSTTTLGYGEIAEKLTSSDRKSKSIRQLAEVERVQSIMDPDGTYLGVKGVEHKARLKKSFEGFMAAGYSKEDVYEAMAEQGMAIINVGSGFCFGGVENYDESLPCIGTLRCNPIRCSNAVVGKANAPKWREVYFSNKVLLGKEGYQDRESQIRKAMSEAKEVLKLLGEEIVV
jgi:integrase